MLRKTKYTKDMDVTVYMICGTNINAQRSSIQKNYMIQQVCIDVHESNTSESRLDAAPLDHLATHISAYSYRPIISPTNTV